MSTRSRVVASLAAAAALAGCGSTLPAGEVNGVGLATTSGTGGTSGPSAAGPGVAAPGGSTQTGASRANVAGSMPGSSVVQGSGASVPGQPLPGTSPGGLALTGRGWDAKNIYIGIPTADDFNGRMASLGAKFNNGSAEGDVQAILDDINKAGGVLGRKVVAVYHDATSAEYASNPASTGQAMCTYFTQDRPVVAVIEGSPQLDGQPSFHGCLEHAATSLFSLTNTDFGDQDYASLGPNLFTAGSLSTDILIPSLAASLNRQHFFTGWDVRAGGPGPEPVKVGILEPDSAQGHHVAALMQEQLRRLSMTVASTFFYDPSGLGSKSQAEVLQFQSAGVTHVLDLPPVEAEILQFQLAAEQQRYRPRYGITSDDLPLSVEENSNIVPPAQQVGSMGLGWQPFNDVDATHDPGQLPGSKRCLDALKRGGQSFDSTQRRAAFAAVLYCDGIYLLRDAAVAAKGLTASSLLAGVADVGPRLATAGTFGSTLSGTDHGVPGYYRDLQYDPTCGCFRYVGQNRLFSRS